MCFCELRAVTALPDKSDSPAVADNVLHLRYQLTQPVIQQARVINIMCPWPLSVWLMLKICVLVALLLHPSSAR